MKGRTLVWLLLLVPVLLVALLYWRFSAAPQMVATELMKQGFWLNPQRPVVHLPEVPNHLGGTFSRDQLEGRWNWVFFGYSHCPDICGPSLALLRRAKKVMLGRNWSEDEIQMLMVSVDPGGDTPQSMRAFIDRLNPGMLGLLPDENQLKSLATVLHAGYSAPRKSLIDHTGNIVLLDPEGRYLGYFQPPTTVDQVVGVSDLARRVWLEGRR